MKPGLGIGIALSLSPATVQGPPLAQYALALDFKNGAYWKAGVQAASLASMAGYSYTRTGQVSFIDNALGVTTFAANAPPILAGVGYQAVGALTNALLQSQTFDAAGWQKTSLTVTANTQVAPDGNTTADTVARGSLGTTISHQMKEADNALTASAVHTYSVFLKRGTGRYAQISLQSFGTWAYANFDLQNGVVGTTANGATGYIIPLANGWYRCVVVATMTATTASNTYIVPVDSAAAANTASSLDDGSTLFAWQAQCIVGNFPDGGPIIATVAASASIGAEALSVSVPNATYSAVYTFDDGSTQTIPTVISGGAFVMPAFPTLNRPAVKQVTLT